MKARGSGRSTATLVIAACIACNPSSEYLCPDADTEDALTCDGSPPGADPSSESHAAGCSYSDKYEECECTPMDGGVVWVCMY
jgi:hypothetical protein